MELECVNYMEESSLEQVAFEPSNVWLTVQGGAGAHGGCFELLRWDGQSLTVVISSFNSSPNAGSVADLDGDGQLDLVLNNSDQYIFCYTCGMKIYGALIFRWDGQDLVEVSPAPLTGDQAAALRVLNDHAVELAAAGLFADALAKLEEAEALAPEDPTVRWNAVWVRNYLEESRQLASTSPFPLLNHAFAGDWEAAFDALWTIGLPALSGDAPIASDSAAFGFEERVGNLLASYADTALALQPERAALHALGAWGRYLLNSDDPAVHRGFRRAAEVAGEDSRYNRNRDRLRRADRHDPGPANCGRAAKHSGADGPVGRRVWDGGMTRRAMWRCNRSMLLKKHLCLSPTLTASRRTMTPLYTRCRSTRPGRAAGRSWAAWSCRASTTWTNSRWNR